MKMFGLISCTALIAVLSGCGPMTQEDIASIRGALNGFQAQNDRINAQSAQMVQEGQRNMPTVQQTQSAPVELMGPKGFRMKRGSGVTVYCIELTDKMVSCKPI